jgi:2-polyprenyl-3-methyl-5-hydroxy-6-metoxy-1,4-benzoquinol methylase/glycosyltransferase involved in cell wall biosynthesis
MSGALNIQLHALGMPFDGATVATRSLGGSESAAYYLARGLAARGHAVTVWTGIEAPASKIDGVTYQPVGACTKETPLGERFEHYARNTPHDVLIIQRGATAFHRPFASKVNIWQLHDLALHRYTSSMMGGMWQVDAVTCVSDYHLEQVRKVWNINPATLHVVRNAVDPALYAAPLEPLSAPLPNARLRLLYQSRPERGLEHLVRPGGIMDRCRDLDAALIVTSYDNTVEAMRGYYEQLAAWGAALPNVVWLPPLAKPQLAALQSACDLLIYPTEFEEVSCITAMEAMHAALPMLTSDVGALAETCRDAGVWLLPLKDGRADEDAFVERLPALLQDPVRLTQVAERQRAAAARCTWDGPVAALEALCWRLLDAKLTSARVLRHAIEHSDIDFARWCVSQIPATITDPGTDAARAELQRLYAFTESDAAYAAHYAKHQAQYYDDFEERVVGEDVTGTTRFRGVLNAMVEIRNRQSRASRVLDYGCAHGHYLLPLAKLFSDSEFVGVDISDRAVAAARKWVDRDKVANARVYSTDSAAWQKDKYDVIIAAEVLEHVRDDRALLEQLAGMLTEDGAIIFTTPNGRWEWSGTVAFRTGREHLRHYERKDIVDLCGANEHLILHAPASHDQGGRPLGSWVWTVWPREPWGTIDYARKLREYAPRETVSACMIVRDGEKTLRGAVESFIDYVDELHICIDPLTRDRTAQVAEELREDFPNRPIHCRTATKSATRDGFDEARNESIEEAAGDWILWVDADETVRTPERLHMFLRPSMHNGYGFPQVHYSADPDQVLTTDFPCRLFRNRQGIRFYGVVHEHPEHEMGKAVTWSLVRHELKFLHAGYVDEATRRRRYERNLPLLLRDRAKNPGRQLNGFLMLRDIAQGLMFEQQQTGGYVLGDHRARAAEGIRLMEELVASPEAPIRMITDCLQYYSHCVVTSGGGFDAAVTLKTATEAAPDLSVALDFRGRFHTRDFYQKVVRKFSEESTKLYEDRYL